MSINQVTLSGFVGAEPVMKYFESGNCVCEVNLGVKKYDGKDTNGATKYRTVWIQLKAFSKLGETIGENVKKGDKLVVEGTLDSSEWEKDGVKRKSHFVIVSNYDRMVPKTDAA